MRVLGVENWDGLRLDRWQLSALPSSVMGRWAIPLLMAIVTLAGCLTPAPYFLVESRLVQNQPRIGEPDVTETVAYRLSKGRIRVLGLQPPDVCADLGQSASGGNGQLQHGILHTRCGVEMAQFERALARAGYEVVSWGAVQHMSRNEETPLLESARELGIELLLQVNALERIEIQPGRDARFERRFFRATRNGEKVDPAAVDLSLAHEFESLIKKKEASLAGGKRVGATINVSAISVESGTTIWFYEATKVDDFARDPEVQVLIDCQGVRCIEVKPDARAVSDGPVEGSISSISLAGDPQDGGPDHVH